MCPLGPQSDVCLLTLALALQLLLILLREKNIACSAGGGLFEPAVILASPLMRSQALVDVSTATAKRHNGEMNGRG